MSRDTGSIHEQSTATVKLLIETYTNIFRPFFLARDVSLFVDFATAAKNFKTISEPLDESYDSSISGKQLEINLKALHLVAAVTHVSCFLAKERKRRESLRGVVESEWSRPEDGASEWRITRGSCGTG